MSEKLLTSLIEDEAESYAIDKLCLIGDAAHSTNNFGIQSENLSLIDAAILANTLIKARRSGYDIGSYS